MHRPTSVSASLLQENPASASFEQQDLDGDGDPDLAVLEADYAEERFRILIYDQAMDMQWSEDWRTGTDFLNDVWLFQTESGEQTKLIIRFSHGPEGYLAELYDDFNGDGDVAWRTQNLTGIQVLESSYPTLRVEAAQPWLLPDRRVNYMVRFTLRRPLPVWFMQVQYFTYLPAEGSISFANEVIDSDGDGNPDYELGLAFPDAPVDRFVFRSQINVNVSDVPRPSFDEAFLWPYLGYAFSDGWSEKQVQRRPEDLSPPIKVDWQAGRIMGVAPLLPFYGLGNQSAILSSKPIEKDQVNELDWEVFAYYDFTGDTVMDVLFRLLHQPVDPVVVGTRSLRLEQVSYAWHHQSRDTIAWDYELELAALHELPSTVVEFEDFGLYTVPYEDLLWHYSRPSDWAYATFVAAESNAYQSNEGIWEWGALEGIQTDLTLTPEERFVPDAMNAQHNYLRGLAADSPAGLYTSIREGFRGEYADLVGPASLYFSGIDRRLHLTKAQKGLWNLGDNREIQYQSLGGLYLDTWTLLDNGEPTKALYAPPGYLIYADGSGVQVFQTDTEEALFTTIPPRNRAEWQELDGKLAQYQADFAPDDLHAMAERSGRPLSAMSNASIRDLRLTEGGFRFVLDLQPGFTAGGSGGPDLTGLPAGAYVVTLSGGVFAVQPLTPALLTLELALDSPEDSFDVLRARVANQGLADLAGLRLSVVQACRGQTHELGGEAFDLHGQASRDVSLLLPPLAAQSCTITATILDGAGTALVENRLEIPPAGSAGALAGQVLRASSGGGRPALAYLLLGLLGTLFSGLAAVVYRRGSN